MTKLPAPSKTLFPEWVAAHTDVPIYPERILVMWTMYGKTPEKLCGSCAHLLRRGRRTRRYYKCGLSTITHGPGTDWLVHWWACGKHE